MKKTSTHREMPGHWRPITIGVLALVSALAMAFTAQATTRALKYRHVNVTFSGSGGGNYSNNTPEVDTAPGVCSQAQGAYTTVDHFTFGDRFQLGWPDGSGNPGATRTTAGGVDQSSYNNPACTDGFGDQEGGESFSCRTPFTPAPMSQSSTPYPTAVFGGSGTHPVLEVTGGVALDSPPTGTNCIGAQIGTSARSYQDKLNIKFSFSAAALEKHGSLSDKVHASTSLSCNSTSCNDSTCAAHGAPGPSPITCNTVQSYMGELKITLAK